MKKQQKSIPVMISKRANVFYLERCRVMVKDANVIYLSQEGKDPSPFFNIPEKNTAFLLLGKGTSITDAAARQLADSNVLVGFCGSGGTPLFSMVDFAFLNPISEYRPTEYMHQWIELWMNPTSRLSAAKLLLNSRLCWLKYYWSKYFPEIAIPIEDVEILKNEIQHRNNIQNLLLAEARWAKSLYKSLATQFGISNFSRQPLSESTELEKDIINNFIDHGNYLAYGYAATALSGLGISFTLPLLHGKTRRGGLVFDIADLFKDAIVLPIAFKMGKHQAKDKELRAALIEIAFKDDLLTKLFTFLKTLPEKTEENQLVMTPN